MAEIISTVTQIFTAIMGWVGTLSTTIVETPILLVFAILPLAFLGVRMFKKLIHAGRG